MGLEFKHKVPFKQVLIHGLVLDKFGKKMSKSRPETIVDPQDIIDNFGADTLRFTLATGTALGQDQRFQMEKVEGSRNFTNKIWNAARFVLMHDAKVQSGNLLDEVQLSQLNSFAVGEIDQISEEALALPDQWILMRLEQVTMEVTKLLERFDLGAAASLLYEFLWNEYCDWYIEFSKPQLYQEEDVLARKTTLAILTRVLRQTMELLHPFMPFLTEEIWQALPHRGESIMVARWPVSSGSFQFETAGSEIATIIEVIRAIRNIRAEANLPPSKKVTAVFAGSEEKNAILRKYGDYVENLSGLASHQFISKTAPKPEKAISAVAGGITVLIPLAGLVDVTKERERLTKEMNQLEFETAKLISRLESPAFTAKAPPPVVAKEREKLTMFADKIAKIKERLAELGE